LRALFFSSFFLGVKLHFRPISEPIKFSEKKIKCVRVRKKTCEILKMSEGLHVNSYITFSTVSSDTTE
jgi:hypothetical protein